MAGVFCIRPSANSSSATGMGQRESLGGAGTGKTVVAMHRAVWLARKYANLPGKPVLFTTYTRTLADDIATQIAMITTPAERDRIEIVNVDQWARGIIATLWIQAGAFVR